MLIIAAVAGGLFITLAVVEWALSRLEPEREGRGKAVPFLAVGIVCLLGAGGLAWANRHDRTASAAAPVAQSPVHDATAGELAGLELLLKEPISLAQRVADGSFEPELPTILDVRRQIMVARKKLSASAYPTSAASSLHSQSDIVLGVAYQTLGFEWILQKQNLWNVPVQRETATAPLKRELAKWNEIRDCLKAGRDDCAPEKSTNPKHLAIIDFIGWLHPYMIELTRFQESDTDLVFGTPEEISRVHVLITKAQEELRTAPKEAWDPKMVKAAAALLTAADTALNQEAAARAEKKWTIEEMQRVDAPVVAAFDNLMTAIMEAR